MRLSERTLRTARLHPALRCVCGRMMRGHDLDIRGNGLRLICAHCGRALIEIPVCVIDDAGERHW